MPSLFGLQLLAQGFPCPDAVGQPRLSRGLVRLALPQLLPDLGQRLLGCRQLRPDLGKFFSRICLGPRRTGQQSHRQRGTEQLREKCHSKLLVWNHSTKTKKPAWWNTRRYSAKPAYSLTNHPKPAGLPFIQSSDDYQSHFSNLNILCCSYCTAWKGENKGHGFSGVQPSDRKASVPRSSPLNWCNAPNSADSLFQGIRGRIVIFHPPYTPHPLSPRTTRERQTVSQFQ